MGEINRYPRAVPMPLLFAQELIAIGDSIVFGDQVGGIAHSWPIRLAQLRGWDLVANAGMNGSSLSTGGGNPVVLRYGAAIPEGYSGHVMLMAGTNDYNIEAPLGFPGSTNPVTVYGALLVTARGILNRAPCYLHLLTPTWRGDAGRTEGTRVGSDPAYTLEQVRQAVRDVAAQMSREFPGRVQLIDLGRTLTDYLTDQTYMGADLLHPREAGHILIAQHLAAHCLGSDEAATPSEAYGVEFGQLMAGTVDRQDGWTVHGGTGQISGQGLTVYAPYDAQPRGTLHALPAGTQRVTARIYNDNRTDQGVIVRAFHSLSNDQSVCVWLITGNLDFGVIQGKSVDSWLRGNGPFLPLGEVYLELLRTDSQYEVRWWAVGSARPASPVAVHDVVAVAGDTFGFGTIGTSAQRVISVQTSGE